MTICATECLSQFRNSLFVIAVMAKGNWFQIDNLCHVENTGMSYYDP